MGKDMINEPKARGSDFWTIIGQLSFGLLGIMIGAALLYGIFSFFFGTEDPLPQAAEREDDYAIVLPPPAEDGVNLVEVVETIMPAVVGVNKHVYLTQEGLQALEEVESGSGVIVSSDGYIITNYHVVQGADYISVILPGKGRYEAELTGADLLTDLAVLKIDDTGLDYVIFGDSDQSRVGETVLAFGNPLGYFQQSVTAGIISAIRRQVRVPGSEYAYTFIQTDALVNPGNSGGPLVNRLGETIGINTAKVSLPGVEGIGLSIPSNTVQRVLKDIVEHGKVRRPHLGVIIEDWLDYGGRQPERGVLIRDIALGSAADQGGLLPGDIIVSIKGEKIFYVALFFDVLFKYYPGDTVTVQYYRDGRAMETEVTLGERPETMPVVVDLPDLQEEPAQEEEETIEPAVP